jgi:LuxR family maltose regulon positive regulatory protein
VANTGSVPLLATKVRAPRSRPGVIPRGRLVTPLRGTPALLTLVSAPAGFGKTTLLADWLATVDATTVAWVQLDAGDNDPVRFWSYVVAALRAIAPDVGSGALPLFESSDVPTEAAVATLLNELDAVDHEVVLVLDDYHVIDAREIQDAMTFFLEHLPSPVRLVVAGRADPPWPLATFRARGDLREVRAADLRFTVDEATTYLNETMGLALQADDVRTIEDRTEGWIAALQLAALSMQGRDDVSGFVADFAGDDRYIVDYLVGEVLVRQTEHDRSFLLHTSLLGRLTAPLCDAVTGRGCAQETLERLDRTNLFLVALDDRRVWYRYHHLFAEMLRARLHDDDPGMVAEIHRRASSWHEQHGDAADAIGHAIAGEDFERAAGLVERAAPATSRSRQETTLRGWLEALPDALLADRPVLAMALVGARMATGDVTGVETLLQGVERWLDPPEVGTRPGAVPVVVDREEFRRLPAQAAIQRAGLSLLAGDADATIAHAHRALALLDPSDRFGHGAATALQGLASWSIGDLATARRGYEDALRDFVAAGHMPDLLGVTLGLADIQFAQGLLHDAAGTLELGLDRASEHHALRGTADMHVALSEVRLEQGDLDAADRHLQTSQTLGEHAGLPQHAYRWRAATARLLQARGDVAGAIELLDAAERVYNTDFSPAARPIAARRVRLLLTGGDVDAALRWARDHDLHADDELAYVREYEHVTLARTLLAAHATGRAASSLDDAIGLLTRLFVAADDGGRSGTAIEVLVLLALAYAARGDGADADDRLREAVVRAAPEGWIQLFRDEGPQLAARLRTTSLDGVAREHARRVLATGPAAVPVTHADPIVDPIVDPLVDPLSGRELEVLRLLRSDLSGPDIARELYVSLNTLRTHTKAIYTKLGVNSRRAAVRRAEELGL